METFTMAGTDFLSFLVDETLKLQTNGASELSSLEHKLKDYGLQFMKGEFVPQSQMLRFKTSFGVLDFPVNWSVFDIGTAASQDIVLSSDFDDDHLLEVLKHAWNPNFTKILVTHAEGFCYLVGLESGEESHLHDLMTPQEWLRAA
jgi:hypothetical protein